MNSDIADTETIRRNLNRLTKGGILRRIINGIYEKPKYSKLVDEYVAVDPATVAQPLSTNKKWKCLMIDQSKKMKQTSLRQSFC